METVAKVKEFIGKAVELLDDEAQKNYFTSVSTSLETASEMADDEEKKARLKDASVRYVNQLAFILFRADKLDGELLAEFRALPTPEAVSADTKAFEAARQERIDEINNMHQAIIDEQKSIDLFTAVVSGMSKEEAESRMAAYEEEVAKASEANR